jgi:hypothetical protein
VVLRTRGANVEFKLQYRLYFRHLGGGYGNAGIPERRSGAGMKGGAQPPFSPILAERDKSRERELSALAVSEPCSL